MKPMSFEHTAMVQVSLDPRPAAHYCLDTLLGAVRNAHLWCPLTNEIACTFAALPAIAARGNVRKRLAAICAPPGILTRIHGQFLVDGRVRRGKAGWELALIGLSVALSVAAWSAWRAGSIGWLIPEMVVLLVVVVLCLKPLTFAVTSYRNHRMSVSASKESVPEQLQSHLGLIDLKEEARRSVAAGATTTEAHNAEFIQFVVQRIEEMDTDDFDIARFCLYMLDHPRDQQTLCALLRALRWHEQRPDLDEASRNAFAAGRRILVQSLGEAAVAEAETAAGAEILPP
jgi:hypothetical protein